MRKPKRVREPEIDVPPKVREIANRRAALAVRYLATYPEVSLKQFIAEVYLLGVTDMGKAIHGNLAVAGLQLARKSECPEFEVM